MSNDETRKTGLRIYAISGMEVGGWNAAGMHAANRLSLHIVFTIHCVTLSLPYGKFLLLFLILILK